MKKKEKRTARAKARQTPNLSGTQEYLLTAYVFGDITPAGKAAVEKELERSPEARAELERLRATQSLLEAALVDAAGDAAEGADDSAGASDASDDGEDGGGDRTGAAAYPRLDPASLQSTAATRRRVRLRRRQWMAAAAMVLVAVGLVGLALLPGVRFGRDRARELAFSAKSSSTDYRPFYSNESWDNAKRTQAEGFQTDAEEKMGKEYFRDGRGRGGSRNESWFESKQANSGVGLANRSQAAPRLPQASGDEGEELLGRARESVSTTPLPTVSGGTEVAIVEEADAEDYLAYAPEPQSAGTAAAGDRATRHYGLARDVVTNGASPGRVARRSPDEIAPPAALDELTGTSRALPRNYAIPSTRERDGSDAIPRSSPQEVVEVFGQQKLDMDQNGDATVGVDDPGPSSTNAPAKQDFTEFWGVPGGGGGHDSGPAKKSEEMRVYRIARDGRRIATTNVGPGSGTGGGKALYGQPRAKEQNEKKRTAESIQFSSDGYDDNEVNSNRDNIALSESSPKQHAAAQEEGEDLAVDGRGDYGADARSPFRLGGFSFGADNDGDVDMPTSEELSDFNTSGLFDESVNGEKDAPDVLGAQLGTQRERFDRSASEPARSPAPSAQPEDEKTREFAGRELQLRDPNARKSQAGEHAELASTLETLSESRAAGQSGDTGRFSELKDFGQIEEDIAAARGEGASLAKEIAATPRRDYSFGDYANKGQRGKAKRGVKNEATRDAPAPAQRSRAEELADASRQVNSRQLLLLNGALSEPERSGNLFSSGTAESSQVDAAKQILGQRLTRQEEEVTAKTDLALAQLADNYATSQRQLGEVETQLRAYSHYRRFDDQLTFEAQEAQALTVPPPAVGDEGLGRDGFRERYGVNPFVDTRRDRFSTFSMDVDTASYTRSRDVLLRGQLPQPESVRVEEFVNHFPSDLTTTDPTRPFSVFTEGAPSPFGAGLDLVRVTIKARELHPGERKRVVLTFVIDTSGSMHAGGGLDLMRSALGSLVQALETEDRVGLVAYNTRAYVVLPHTPAREKERIVGALDGLAAGGGTNVEAGLELAYRIADEALDAKALNRVVLCSDGVANVGSREPEAMLEKVKVYARRGIYLSVVGLGKQRYNDALLERIARDGAGNYSFVANLDEAKTIFRKNLPAQLHVLAEDAKIQVEFNPEVVGHYRLLGYENRDIADRDFRNDKIDAAEIGPGTTVTVLYEIERRTGAHGALGRIFIRYRDTGTRRVDELDFPLPPSVLKTDLKSTSASFRLIACVAETAELLRQSYWARDGSFGKVLDVLYGIEAPYRQRAAWQEITRTATRAQQLVIDKIARTSE